MSAILALWITFLAGFAVGLFFAGIQNAKLRREIDKKCELCFEDPNFGRTVAAAYEMSEKENE